MNHHQEKKRRLSSVTRYFKLGVLVLSCMAVCQQVEARAGAPLSGKRFEWTASLRQAYGAVLHLRFNEAAVLLQEARAKDPGNLMQLHVENYLDFLRVFIDEDEEQFRRLEQNKQRRLRQVEEEGDPASPFYLYVQASIRLQWAGARLKFGEYPTAFMEANKAFQLLSENSRAFPQFMPNKKDLGILHALAGTIPGQYQWALSWLSSMEGSISQGQQELREVMAYSRRHDFIYEQETHVYYAYLMLYLGNDLEEARQAIADSGLDARSSPLACHVLANLAMRSGRGQEAITMLEQRPAGQEYHAYHLLDYLLGLAKLQHLETGADRHLLRFISNHKGRNQIKDAYQKLAWYSLAVEGDLQGYHGYMRLAREKGAAVTESDKSALAEATAGLPPATDLLKARLLFDGGYYQRAFALMEQRQAADYLSEKNKLELLYRKGRIAHKLGRQEEALAWYRQAVERGADSPFYFACRAALERGLIHEQRGQRKEALAAYERCLSIFPQEYRAGLHQQAKAGMKRLRQ